MVAPPVAVVFLIAFLWPRAHGRAATSHALVRRGRRRRVVVGRRKSPAPPDVDAERGLRAGVCLLASLVVMLCGTVAIPQDPQELYDPDTHWSLYWARLPSHERSLGEGPRNLVFWWGLMLAIAAALYIAVR